MIEPTETDLGRRVIYDPGVKGVSKARGTLVGLTGGPMGRWTQVQFDGDEHRSGPLNVGNDNLHWADE